jgi:hypothetical protein
VGTTPSAGVEAEVARGQFVLPEGFSLQVPTGRFTLPDGTIFLEGQGVPLTLQVPVDETFALSSEDEVLKAGERAVLQPLGAGVVPSGPPEFAGGAGAQKAINQGARQLEELAREQYGLDELASPGTFAYTVALSESEPLLWAWVWCAATQEILDENFNAISLEFSLDNEKISSDDFLVMDFESSGLACRGYISALDNWPAGEHHLSTTVTFENPINDGSADYPAGTQIFDYSVYIKP